MDDELLVLQSIYPEICTIKENEISLDFQQTQVPFRFTIQLPKGYPMDLSPELHFVNTPLSKTQKQQVILDMNNMFEKGQVCLFEWIEYLRGWSESWVRKESVELEVEEVVMETKVCRKVDNVIAGAFLVDRKSKFQAHLVHVGSVVEVEAFIAYMLQDRKIAKATHNITAYRIVKDGRVVKDNDEDGEHGAGRKLQHLLEMMQVENVIVMVSRWYGGIHLGPDRFKHINNCARILLEQNGYSQRG